MSAENRLSLLGNVGGVDSIRTFENDEGAVSVISFSFAVTEFRYNPETKQNEKMTDWHTAKAFGWVAPRIARFVEQGQKFLLVGRLAKEDYEKDGETRWSYFLQIEDFALLGGNRNSDQAPESDPDVEDEFPF